MDLRHASHPPTDLELLTIQAAMSLDDRRRTAGTCGVTIAVTHDGQIVFAGSEVPDALVPALAAVLHSSPRPIAPDREPPALAVCRAIVEPCCGALSLDAGPSYLIGPEVQIDIQADIARSDGPRTARLRRLNPGNWEHEEWDDLLNGALGPWAMAVANDRVVSICHTPRPMTEQAAVCGVWTHPDERGRGYAAAVTATWAEILRPSGRFLFYSTDAGDRSSQRVAARLQLRPIGWTWSLTRAKSGQADHRHPLSRRCS